MKNLLRALAAFALTLTALSTGNAATTGTCSIFCFPARTTISASTTKAECCGQDFSDKCPAGSTGSGFRWNGQIC